MKKLIALLAMTSLLVGCDGEDDENLIAPTEVPLPKTCHDVAWGRLHSVYHATFPNGSLDSGFTDSLHSPPLAMKKGDSAVAGATYDVAPLTTGGFRLMLSAPDMIDGDKPPSVGVFSTNLNFPQGTMFVARATFQQLHGENFGPTSDKITNAWSVGVTARTGGEQDLPEEARVSATFRVVDEGPFLSIQSSGSSVALVKAKVHEDIANRILSIDPLRASQPFILQLTVDLAACKVFAALHVNGARTQQIPDLGSAANLPVFFSTAGRRKIETVGATLANCCAPKAKVQAEVTDFEILSPDGGGLGSTDRGLPNPPPINPNDG